MDKILIERLRQFHLNRLEDKAWGGYFTFWSIVVIFLILGMIFNIAIGNF